MTDVFISYSRKDRARVTQLVAAIEAAGFTVWWDKAISAGTEFDREIDTALERARAVIVVWSEDSILSRWVREEADDGLQRNILIPVSFDGTSPPRGFKLVQVQDLSHFDPGHPSEALTALLSRIAEITAKSPTKPKSRTKHAPVPQPSRTGGGMRFPVLGALAVLLGVVITLTAWFLNDDQTASPLLTEKLPTVVGIYPSNAFGPDQRNGLHAALESESRDLRLVDLQASLADMKTQNADAVLTRLAELLESGEVSAIVGPPITEFIGQVLDVVEQYPNPPAVFLTTAASRKAVGWDERDLRIFRVGSGVNERAADFAGLARQLIASDLKMTFLVERIANQSHPSYGEVFFNSIADELPEWSSWVDAGQISRIDYDRGEIVERLRESDADALFNEKQLIFMLGIGGDYARMIDAFYTDENPDRSALLASWMTAYALDEPFGKGGYQYRQIVDLSDVGALTITTNLHPDVQRFIERFGDIRPAMRDLALTYDTGRVIVHALREARRRDDLETIADLTDEMGRVAASRAFQGTFGDISFEGDGQNRGGGRDPVYVMMYDPGRSGWRQVNDMTLLVSKLVAQ